MPSCGRKAPSGRWQARWREPGGRNRIRTFRLKADAERFLIGIEDQKNRGTYNDPNAGRETLAQHWSGLRADAIRTGRLSERTLISYDEIWRLYIEPGLGRRPLNSVSRADVEDVLSRAPSSVRARDVHKVTRMILGRAVRAGKIGTNPASGIDLPKIERREPRTLSAEELDRLVDVMPDRYRAFVLTAAYSSLRWSELVALRVPRLDLMRNRVRVEEKITESGHLIAGEPKTTRARRAVTIPEFVTFEIAEHLRRYPSENLVFTRRRADRSAVPPSTALCGSPRRRPQVWRGSGSDSCGTRGRRWR